MALLLGALALVHVVGPRFGVWLVPPSPQRYASFALETLDEGYYAEGPAWEDARSRVAGVAEYATEISDLHEPLAEATKVAGGKHSFFRTPQQVQDGDASAAAEFTPPTVETEAGVTTIRVPELGTTDQGQLQQYADAGARGIADAAASTCGWVVDLRGNRGGNMYPMLAAVAPLLPDGTGLVFHARSRDMPASLTDGGVAVGGGSPALRTDVDTKVRGQNVAVLYDEMTASSGEAVATFFRGVEGVRSSGTPTAGYTSGNTVVPLYDGARLVLTGSVYVDRNGVNLNEEPMAPDEPTAAADAPTAARAWLQQGSCA